MGGWFVRWSGVWGPAHARRHMPSKISSSCCGANERSGVCVDVWRCVHDHRELSQQGAECSLIGEHIRLTWCQYERETKERLNLNKREKKNVSFVSVVAHHLRIHRDVHSTSCWRVMGTVTCCCYHMTMAWQTFLSCANVASTNSAATWAGQNLRARQCFFFLILK